MTTITSSLSASKKESDSAMTPQEYLAAADAALASDQPLEASRLLWLATESAFIRLAKVHGMAGDDLPALARALDRKEGRKCHYLGKLGTAQALKHNAALDYMEPYQLDSAGESVKFFISETL